jgi:hypothetical protein
MKILAGAAFAVFLIASSSAAPGAPAARAQAEVEISYTMPAAWVAQAIQGGPELKAHYVYMSGGRPYGEMYLSQTPAPAGQTLDQVFQDGLGLARPRLPYYQARGTQRVTVGEVAAVVHDFVYMPSGAGVMFAGRTYTMISGASVFTFFFQTVSDFAASMQSQGAQTMGTVVFTAKPVPAVAPVPPPAVNPAPPTPKPPPAEDLARPDPLMAETGGAKAVRRPDGGLTAEDMGLVYDLPAGWRQTDDGGPAKYRHNDQVGALLATLIIFKPDVSTRLAAALNPQGDSAAEDALDNRIERVFKAFDGYVGGLKERRTIAGYPGAVHDFIYNSQGQTVLYRAVFFAVPGKSGDPGVRVPPAIYPFAFMSTDALHSQERRKQWDDIMASMRIKGAAAPPAPPEPADRGGRIMPPPRPKDKTEGGLPDLQLDEPEAGVYADPFGRYKVALPAGAAQVKVEDNAAYFRMPAPKTGFIVHSYRQEETGTRLAARFAEGRKPNGAPSTMTVGGREASVSLYTGRDEAMTSLVWVVALYSKSGLLIVVSLPAKDYAGAKAWISALLRGVIFGDGGHHT